jgi:hypothetical protein
MKFSKSTYESLVRAGLPKLWFHTVVVRASCLSRLRGYPTKRDSHKETPPAPVSASDRQLRCCEIRVADVS